MDNNQNQTPSQPVQPSTEQAPASNKKSILLLIILFVLILVGVAGIFLFMNNKTSSVPVTTPAVFQAVPTQTPQTPEEELDQVTIESPDEDFQDINTDLEQL